MPGRIAALGDATRVVGFGLAGALTVPVTTSGEVRVAWAALPTDVALVVLTPEAADALVGELADRSSARLVVVMPP